MPDSTEVDFQLRNEHMFKAMCQGEKSKCKFQLPRLSIHLSVCPPVCLFVCVLKLAKIPVVISQTCNMCYKKRCKNKQVACLILTKSLKVSQC